MLTLAALTIATQEAYAVDVGGAGLDDGYCGTNWQGSFHKSLGNPGLSIPAGMSMPDKTSTLGVISIFKIVGKPSNPFIVFKFGLCV
jgi:hypothetical protein